jgi:hypothetical protein
MFTWHKLMEQRFISALLMNIYARAADNMSTWMTLSQWLARRSWFPDSLRLRICILRGSQRLSLSCRTHFFSSNNVSYQTPLIRIPDTGPPPRHGTLRKKLSWLETERDGRTPLQHQLLDEPIEWLSYLIKIVSIKKQQEFALMRVLASNFLCLLIC